MSELLSHIKLDYQNAFVEHIQLFYKELLDFFEQYPEIQAIDFDNVSISLNGVAFINKGKSEILTSPDTGWNNDHNQKVQYSVVVEDKDGKIHKLKNIFPKIEELTHAIREIHKNPLIERSKIKNTLFNKKEDCIPSVKKIYGDDVANLLVSSREKELLSDTIADVNKKSIRETHKI